MNWRFLQTFRKQADKTTGYRRSRKSSARTKTVIFQDVLGVQRDAEVDKQAQFGLMRKRNYFFVVSQGDYKMQEK